MYGVKIDIGDEVIGSDIMSYMNFLSYAGEDETYNIITKSGKIYTLTGNHCGRNSVYGIVFNLPYNNPYEGYTILNYHGIQSIKRIN